MREMGEVSSLVESDKYRDQLMEVRLHISDHLDIILYPLSSLKLSNKMDISDHPHVRQALEKDKKDLSHLLSSVMCSDPLEKSVLELRGNEADAFMKLICKVCLSFTMTIQLPDHFICQIVHRRSFGDDENHYHKAHQLLLKLTSLWQDSIQVVYHWSETCHEGHCWWRLC